MIAIFDGAWNILWLSCFPWFLVHVLHTVAARGTRLRYICASLLPVFLLASITGFICDLIADTLKDEGPGAIAQDLIGLVVWLVQYLYWKRRRDDDDFWRGLGGRIKKRLNQRRARPVTVSA
ncbi:MAG: hypothetical protein EOO40_10100 [Deltaproteobacteria bacterium]|nr:MAG: hypothetical protein EOO40_10100 [Deltaproteobacteria bacterium]